ncbi:MAG: AMP-binding protein, partial [Chloroflexota bacterium]
MKYESFPYKTLDGLLAAQAMSHHDRPFLRHGDECLTYGQVERQAATVAAGLRELGLQPGDRLAVILPNIPAFGVVLFASVKAGLILVPVNVRRGRAEVMARLSKTGPKALITFADPDLGYGIDHLALGLSVQSDLPALKHVISLEGNGKEAHPWSDLLGATAAPVELVNRPEDPAAIVHTLGSFGDPRGAILTQGGLTRNAASMASVLRCQPEDAFLGAVPFSNTFGLTATILAAAAAGAQVVCLPKYHPAKALALIAEESITVHNGVPTMFAMELNHGDFSPELCTSLRTGIMAGAPCPPMLVKRVREEMNCDVILAYGLTETCPAITMTHLDDGPVTSTETVGRPLDGVELKVINPDGEALPEGEEGELCVRGYNVMLGYWDDPEATASVLDANGWLRTGDLAVIDPDGPVRIMGRIDEVVIRGGFKIYPGMVEMVLRSFPGVKEAAVLGVPDMIFGELLVACVVCLPGQDFSAAELMAFASEHLAEYVLPDRILFFDTLPRRGSGPVRKDYLRSRVRIRGRAWKFGKNVDT